MFESSIAKGILFRSSVGRQWIESVTNVCQRMGSNETRCLVRHVVSQNEMGPNIKLKKYGTVVPPK